MIIICRISHTPCFTATPGAIPLCALYRTLHRGGATGEGQLTQTKVLGVQADETVAGFDASIGGENAAINTAKKLALRIVLDKVRSKKRTAEAQTSGLLQRA